MTEKMRVINRQNIRTPIPEETQEESNKKDFYAKLSALAFFALLFFTFFGTGMPFGEDIEDVGDITTSNITNQLVYISLFITALVTLMPNFSKFFTFIVREKFMFLFLLWCLLSVIWSDYSFVSFKRFIQPLTAALVMISFLLHYPDREDYLKPIRKILLLYLVLSIIAVLIIPGAQDPKFDYWRGFASTKNVLGQVANMCIILSAIIFKYSNGRRRTTASIMIIISLALMFGTRSSTSLITFLAYSSLALLISGNKIFAPIGIGKTVSTLIIATILAIIAGIVIFAPDLWKVIPQSAGKDVTFTGRTELWEYIIIEIQKHFLLGAGYQGFWVVESPEVLMLYDVFVWLPNQAHNGYLDLMNELGLIGMIIFIVMLINYFINLFKLKEGSPFVWLIVATLIINIQESTFFRPGHVTGILLMFAYFVLFIELINQDKVENKESAPKLRHIQTAYRRKKISDNI